MNQKTRKIFFLAIVLPAFMLASQLSFGVEPLLYKGVSLGVQKSVFLKKFPEFIKCMDFTQTLGQIHCFAPRGTYAEMPVFDTETTFLEGRLAKVDITSRFDSKSEAIERYDSWLSAITNKFGLPSEKEHEYVMPDLESRGIRWMTNSAQMSLSWTVFQRGAQTEFSTSVSIETARYDMDMLEAAQKVGRKKHKDM